MNTTYKASVTHNKKQPNNIRIDLMHKIDNAKFFDIETDINKQINNLLISICREVFIESYEKGGKEAGAVYDISQNIYALHEATQWGYVEFDEDTSTEYYKVYSELNNMQGIVIHNHNDSGSFSIQDLKSFISNGNVASIIVITCNADIFILNKNEYNDYSELLGRLNEPMKTNMITPDIKEILQKLNLVIRRVTP